MKKIVLLQSLHTILQKKIRFDASSNVPSGRKQLFCNITVFITSKQNLLGCITKCPNIKKIVLLQSLHTILEKKICFDASHNVPTCNHCIYHLQTKFVLIHKRRSHHVENSILAILHTIFEKKIGFDASHNVPTYRK